jgi:hypothetical protein
VTERVETLGVLHRPPPHAPPRLKKEAAPATVTAEHLFSLLWDTMADLLGTAATAALLRRALRGVRSPDATQEIEIARDDLTYRYRVPAAWRRPNNATAVSALRTLCAALRPLLIDLTGPVVARRLDRLDQLRAQGITFMAEEVGS